MTARCSRAADANVKSGDASAAVLDPQHDVDLILDCSFVGSPTLHLTRQWPQQTPDQMQYRSKLLACQLTLILLASVEVVEVVDDYLGSLMMMLS